MSTPIPINSVDSTKHFINTQCRIADQCVLTLFWVCASHCNSRRSVFESWYTLQVLGWITLGLQNCLNFLWHRFNKVLKNSAEVLSILTSQHHRAAAFVSCGSMMQICSSTTFKGAPMDWDLVNVEAVWVQWAYCNIQETSLRLSEICEKAHCPARNMKMDMVSSNTQGARSVSAWTVYLRQDGDMFSCCLNQILI